MALACATWLSLLSCGDAPLCPEAWGEDNRGQSCEPPETVRAAAEERLETGIFGYVVACLAESAEDDCSCEEWGLMEGDDQGGRSFPLGFVDPEGREGTVEVPVRADGTFVIELVPGVQYGGWVEVAIETRPVESSFQLTTGQVSFARVRYGSC